MHRDIGLNSRYHHRLVAIIQYLPGYIPVPVDTCHWQIAVAAFVIYADVDDQTLQNKVDKQNAVLETMI